MSRKEKHKDKDEIVVAVSRVIRFLRDPPKSAHSEDDPPSSDEPMDAMGRRNAALRELVCVFLNYHFQRSFPIVEDTRVAAKAESPMSTQIMRLLEAAYEAHQDVMRGE